QGQCDPSYPDICIPPPPPNLNCEDVGFLSFRVLSPDPHGFDGNDNDGIGCEVQGDSGNDGVGDGDDEEDVGDDDGNNEDNSCHPSYPDICIPPPPPNLNCGDIDARNFEVSGSDPHGFDGNDNDGIGCESESDAPDEPGDEGGDDDGDDGGGGGEPEPEPEPGGGDDDNGGDGGDGGGEEGEGGEGGEGNPNEFDDCVVPPGMDPGDVGC
ncbi:MAG: hypothetical protein M3275_00910, partial [Thermoproteota archaeon]|nr:hypothetical protein [Thermoproteota archaeon]